MEPALESFDVDIIKWALAHYGSGAGPGYTPMDAFLVRIHDEQIHHVWHTVGTPTPDKIVEIAVLLRSQPEYITRKGLYGLEKLAKYWRTNDELRPPSWNIPDSYEPLTKLLVGELMPEIPTNEEPGPQEVLALEACGICSGSSRKSIRLYCGHDFCRKCIVRHGRVSTACPVCENELCIDLRSPYTIPATVSRCHIYANTVNEQLILPNSAQVPQFDLSGKDPTLAGPEFDGATIQINIKGIPILAYLVNCNMYTMVSASAAKALKLKRHGSLKSKDFVNTGTNEVLEDTMFYALEPFTISLGSVQVNLSTAVEVDPSPFPFFGIQLGYDFLSSGETCKVTVLTGVEYPEDGETIKHFSEVSNTGLVQELDVEEDEQNSECLFYSSLSGETVTLPVLWFDPFNKEDFHGISMKNADLSYEEFSTKHFDVCFWCNRAFPKGMQVCESCHSHGVITTYCSPTCQKTARTVHKKTVERLADAMDDVDQQS